MFEYHTPEVSALADTARRQYLDGSPIISVGSLVVTRDAVLITRDGYAVNVVRAFLVACDALGISDATRQFEDADAFGFGFDEIAEMYSDAVNGTTHVFDIVENEDGSAHAVTATATPKRVTDTTAVVVKKADGTTVVTRQTAYDALAVIVEGQRKLLAEIEEGTRNNYRDDIDAELVTN